MKKEAISISEVSPYGVQMSGPGVLDTAASLSKFIKNDSNLSFEKKESMLALLDNPQTVHKIMAGYTGGKIMDAITEHKKMHPVTKVLLHGAGFSLAEQLYKIIFREGHFVKDNPERYTYKVRL